MRIIYHHRIRSKDGQFVHMEELIQALKRRGHEIVLVGPKAVSEDRLGGESPWLDRFRQLVPKAAYELLELGYGFLATWRLWKAVRAHAPDLVYERYNLHAPAGAILRWLTGVPLILEVNAPLAEERQAHGGLGLPRLARWVEGRIWRAADCVIAVTDVLAGRIEKARVPRERIAVMPNGIDLERFEAAPDHGEAKRRYGLEGATVLGFIGFVRPWHGLEQVIDWLAASGRQDLLLAVAGTGPAIPMLENHARSLGISERIRFLGVVEREDVPACLAAFDIALQPAVVDYASPLKLFEYMASAKAILAPASPNIEEILSHEVDALLGNAGDLTDRLQRLVDSEELRMQLGVAAKETLIRRKLTWDRNAVRVETIALGLAGPKSEPTDGRTCRAQS